MGLRDCCRGMRALLQKPAPVLEPEKGTLINDCPKTGTNAARCTDETFGETCG